MQPNEDNWVEAHFLITMDMAVKGFVIQIKKITAEIPLKTHRKWKEKKIRKKRDKKMGRIFFKKKIFILHVGQNILFILFSYITLSII